ncbi:DNA adenine methylase [Geomonas sp. Red276]
MSNPIVKPFTILPDMPERALQYPQLRFMGSKFRLLPWIHDIVSRLEFDSVVDAFSGSGCVSYLFKTMGKEIISNDFLAFTHQLALATIENPGVAVTDAASTSCWKIPTAAGASSRRPSQVSSLTLMISTSWISSGRISPVSIVP